MSEAQRVPIYCSCHGDVVMGYRVNGQIVWYDERHGERHIAVLTDEALDKSPKVVQTKAD